MGRRAKSKQPPPQPLADAKQKSGKAVNKKSIEGKPAKLQSKPKTSLENRPQTARAEQPVKLKASMNEAKPALSSTSTPKSLSKGGKGKPKATQAVPASEDEFGNNPEWANEDVDEFDVEGEEDENDDDDEEESEDAEEDEEGDGTEDEDENDEEQDEVPSSKASSSRREKAHTQDDMSVDNVLDSLGLPKGKPLTERQKKKLRAEAERLEELLKSQGYSLEDEEEPEQGNEEMVDKAYENEQHDEDTDEEANGGGQDDQELVNDEDLDSEEVDSEEVGDDDEDDVGEETLDDLPEDEYGDEFEGDAEELEDDDLEDDDDAEEGESGFLLPTVEEEEEEQRAPLDLQFVQMRIREVAKILSNLSQLGEPGRSRADYLDRLCKDVQVYYGYNEFLANMFLELFAPEEAIGFFEANEVPRPVTIRVNTLKTRRRDLAQKLINRGVSLEPIGPWSKVGLQVFESAVPIGATPEYLVGDYMLQAVSSFLPCIALAPQPGERVLDMASAPGGKVTYLSALMQNTGCVFANDSNKARIKSLTANVHRMGCRNVVVCNYDGRQFPKVLGGFDRVLLDSPCSGTGVISKDPGVKTNKAKRDFILLSQLQKQLILCAIDSVSPKSETGGYVVYSTCSVTVEENEEVVEYALRKRPNVRIVPTGIEFGRDGFKAFRGKKFDERMPLCRRIFPHAHNLDGFFVCKLKVELPNKGAKRRQEAEEAAIDAAAEADTAPTPVKRARKTEAPSVTLFNDEEDDAIIQRSREREARKRRS